MNFEALERRCVVAAEMVGGAGICTLITSLYLDLRLLFIYIPLYPSVCLIRSEPRACQLLLWQSSRKTRNIIACFTNLFWEKYGKMLTAFFILREVFTIKISLQNRLFTMLHLWPSYEGGIGVELLHICNFKYADFRWYRVVKKHLKSDSLLKWINMMFFKYVKITTVREKYMLASKKLKIIIVWFTSIKFTLNGEFFVTVS